MPSTINGIGTHYYFKSNRDEHKGVCTHCGHPSLLKSYDTWHCACFLYVPLVPLGKKRILEQCTVCGVHSMMPVKQWNDMIQLAIPAACERYEQELNLQTATEVHAALLAGRKGEGAAEIREEAIEALPNHAAELTARFAWQLTDFHQHLLAKELMEKAYETDPENHAARAGVAAYEIPTNVDAATDKLSFLLEKGSGADPYFYLLDPLIGELKEKRKFETALRYSDHVVAERPEIAQSDAFRSRHREIERAAKRRQTNLPGLERSIFAVLNFRDSTVASWKRYLAFTTIVCVLTIGAIGASNFYVQSHRTVHVVSSVDKDLTLSFDGGEPIALQVGRFEVQLTEGAHHAVLSNTANGESIETDFEIESSFPKRLINPKTWIFNATGAHVLSVVSYAQVARAPSVQWGCRFGAKSYDNIDHLFTEPPSTVRVKNLNTVVTKRILFDLTNALDESVAMVEQQGNSREAMAIIGEYLTVLPDNAELVSTYARLADRSDATEQAVALLAKNLDNYPPQADWHRAYMRVSEDAESDRELIRRYDEWIGRYPEDSTLLSLRAELTVDINARLELLEKAASLSPDDETIQLAIAEALVRAGRFREADERYNQLAAKKDEDPIAPSIPFDDQLSAHLARTKICDPESLDSLADSYRQSLGGGSNLAAQSIFLVDNYLLQQEYERAESLVDALEREATADPYNRLTRDAFRSYFRRMTAGRFGKVPVTLSVTNAWNQSFSEVLASGSAETILKKLESAPEDISPRISFYASAVLRFLGEEEQAEVWRERSLVDFRSRSLQDRTDADLLDDPSGITVEQVDAMTLWPNYKAILLSDLARRFPEKADAYLQRARHYHVSFIHWGRLSARLLELPTPSDEASEEISGQAPSNQQTVESD